MLFDQHNDEVGRDETNDSTGHIDDWDSAEAKRAHFLQTIDLAHALHNFNLLRVPLKQVLNADVFVRLWQVIPQQWHLLHSNGIVVQTAVARFGNTEGDSDGEQRRKEVIDTLSRLQHDYREGVGQPTVACQHSRCTNDDVRLSTDFLNLRIETIDKYIHVDDSNGAADEDAW